MEWSSFGDSALILFQLQDADTPGIKVPTGPIQIGKAVRKAVIENKPVVNLPALPVQIPREVLENNGFGLSSSSSDPYPVATASSAPQKVSEVAASLNPRVPNKWRIPDKDEVDLDNLLEAYGDVDSQEKEKPKAIRRALAAIESQEEMILDEVDTLNLTRSELKKEFELQEQRRTNAGSQSELRTCVEALSAINATLSRIEGELIGKSHQVEILEERRHQFEYLYEEEEEQKEETTQEEYKEGYEPPQDLTVVAAFGMSKSNLKPWRGKKQQDGANAKDVRKARKSRRVLEITNGEEGVAVEAPTSNSTDSTPSPPPSTTSIVKGNKKRQEKYTANRTRVGSSQNRRLEAWREKIKQGRTITIDLVRESRILAITNGEEGVAVEAPASNPTGSAAPAPPNTSTAIVPTGSATTRRTRIKKVKDPFKEGEVQRFKATKTEDSPARFIRMSLMEEFNNERRRREKIVSGER